MYDYAIGIEYNGAQFHGAQRQKGVRTVQEELEAAISSIAAEDIRIQLAGRTDAGVHATNQIVSFSTKAQRRSDEWIHGVNSKLGTDIAVHSLFSVSKDFHARYSALRRRYQYVFGCTRYTPAFNEKCATWIHNAIDASAFDALARIFVGEKDFSSFCASQDDSTHRYRDVQRFFVRRLGSFIVLDITANAFLLRMVRNIAGCFLSVGRGELSIHEVQGILEAKDRRLAPPTAPPNGLYLVHVEYSEITENNDLRTPPVLGPSAITEFENSPAPIVSFVQSDQVH